MKTIAIIPARGGSKRLPNKNVLDFGGIPLLVHSIMYAKANSSIIDAVYVSTNDDAIKKIALQYGAQVIDRPTALSDDTAPTVSALKHVLEVLDNTQIENVVLLQPTNPLRPESLLRDCYQIFQQNNCESLFTVSQSHHKLGKISNHRFVPFNYEIGQRSQDLEPLFFENGLLYLAKAALIVQNTLISENAYPFKVHHIYATVDIDTQNDLDYAEYLIQKLNTAEL